jgi:hypothetical protein
MSKNRAFGYLALIFVLAAGIIFPYQQHASGAASPRLLSTYPTNGQTLVANNAIIELTFNTEVNDIDRENVAVYMKKTATSREQVSLKQIAPGPDNNIYITPESSLLGNHEYLVEIDAGSIVFKDDPNPYPRAIRFSFKTSSMSFYDLMVVNSTRLENLLFNYLPRDIIVSAPPRYIEEINILDKKRGKTGTNAGQAVTGSATNIDIVTTAKDVSTVRIDITEGSKLLHHVYAKPVVLDNPKGQSKTKLFSMGFNKLPKQYDVTVLVMDSLGNRIDSKIVRAAAGEDIFQSIEEEYEYETAGNSYSLYELLEDKKLFDTLLEENEIKKIMVQVKR